MQIGWSAYCEIRDKKKVAEKLDKVLAKYGCGKWESPVGANMAGVIFDG